MKIRVFYENGTKEVLGAVKGFGIAGSDKVGKDGHILHQVAIRFDDDDADILRDVRRIEEV